MKEEVVGRNYKVGGTRIKVTRGFSSSCSLLILSLESDLDLGKLSLLGKIRSVSRSVSA